MNHSIPSPPEGNVDVLSAAGVFLLRLPREHALGYQRRHPGTRIADAAPPRQDRRQEANDAPAMPTYAVERLTRPSAFYEVALAA